MYNQAYISISLLLLSTKLFISLSNSEFCRCVPDQPCWPSIDEWNGLNETVHGRLSIPKSPVDACLNEGPEFNVSACNEAVHKLGKDPFYLQTLSGGTESTGQAGAWTAMPSTYAIEAMDEIDISEGVKFAQTHNLRLVVKGTGHDYYGRSNYADSLLIWTHSMRNMEFHDNFIPEGCKNEKNMWSGGIPAVTMQAGLTWMDVYAAASVDRDLYVQGGGCTSVGVVGWHIGGGFGSFSKMFGTGPANLLEVKIVDAEGNIKIANECQNTELFYAMRGGGYGFGVVVSLTSRTHPIPEKFGFHIGSIQSTSEEATVTLFAKFLDFYQSSLTSINWGEQVRFTENALSIGMVSVDISKDEAEAAWKPLKDWVLGRPDDYTYDVTHGQIPFKLLWNKKYEELIGNAIPTPYDPREPDRSYFWPANVGEISAYWLEYRSRFLMNSHFMEDTHVGAKKLFDLAKNFYTGFSIHFNKAQYAASQWAVDELRNTPMHPSIKDSFGLMIAGNSVVHYSPLVPNKYQNDTSNINDVIEFCGTEILEDCWALKENEKAINVFRDETPGAGAYFNEADYFEPNFQETFWGKENYDYLYNIKQNVDPNGLFYCHNCVGSEDWEEGGMCRK